MTYEINVQKNEDDSKKEKTIAFKAFKISQSSSDEVDSDEQDEVAMITRQVRKFLQKKKRSQGNFKEFKKNFTSKGESNKEKILFVMNARNQVT